MAFRPRLPIFNHYSFDVADSSEGRLLDPQLNALRSLQEFFAQNLDGRIAMVSMPTGSGKSGVISCLPYFLGKLGLDRPLVEGAPPTGIPLHSFDKPILVIAPDLAIAAQLEGVLIVAAEAQGENFLIKRGIVPQDCQFAIPKGVKIEETSEIRNPEFLQSIKGVIIANAQKFSANWEDELPDDCFKLVIVDEAHHYRAKTWHRIIRKFRDHAMVVFFTATPFKGDGKRVLENEEGEIVYRLSLEDARSNRIIRKIKWHETPGVQREREDIFTAILEQVMVIQQAKNRENPLPGNIPHMAIAITKDIEDAELVRNIWNNRWGNSAISYHSKPKDPMKDMMQDIKNNQVKLVVVVDMLREGFDHPPISIAAIMTKIVSPVKFAQFIGRAQRIVRGQEVPESEEICTDVITHSCFEQGKNMEAFESEALIPVN